MYPTSNDVLVQQRIADLMRVSADIHRGPEGVSGASRLTGALSSPVLRLASWIELVAGSIAAAIGIHRPAAGT
jgi:hypothetical protein